MLQEQPNFFKLFEQSAAPSSQTATARSAEGALTNAATAAATAKETVLLSFVTCRQLEVLKTSPYAQFVRDKSLEELRELDSTFGTKLWKNSSKSATDARRLEEWRTAHSSAQTVALEAEYLKIDERFCHPETGVFFLVNADGMTTAVGYKFHPFYFDSSQNRTGTPVHHIEFKSEVPTEISETGYRSHFFSNIPVSTVKNFADFLLQVLRIALKVRATVIFEEIEYLFDASMIPIPSPKRKKSNCPECGGKLDADNQCLECDFSVGDDDEDDYPEDDEDLFDDE